MLFAILSPIAELVEPFVFSLSPNLRYNTELTHQMHRMEQGLRTPDKLNTPKAVDDTPDTPDINGAQRHIIWKHTSVAKRPRL